MKCMRARYLAIAAIASAVSACAPSPAVVRPAEAPAPAVEPVDLAADPFAVVVVVLIVTLAMSPGPT